MTEICINKIISDLVTGVKWLVLWVAPNNKYGYWLDIKSNSRIPVKFSVSDIIHEENNNHYEFSDYIYPNDGLTEEHISETEREHRDRLWDMMRYAVESEPEIYEKKSRASILKMIADEKGIKLNNLYKLLDKYWRSGKTKNAFLPQFSRRGGKGTIHNQVRKIGRRHISGAVIGKVLSDADRENFEQAVHKYYLNQQKLSFKSTYEKLLEKYYANRDTDGRLRLPETSGYPTFRQFQYWYYKNRDITAEKKKRDGLREFELNDRAVLGKSDYGLMGPGAQFQVDATVGDIYLVSQFDRSNIVGRPILYFIMDTFSRMVVGMSVGLEGPSWSALAAAITNMAADKVAFCNKYGVKISKNDWPCRHVPASLLGDRGELESKNADPLVSLFGIRIVNAPPYRADLKGLIEQHFRIVNIDAISQLPGSVKPDMSKRGGHDYRLDATLDIRQLTQIIIKCVLYYNNCHYMESFEKSEALTAAEVEAIPLKLWEWGIQNCSGALRVFPEETVKFAVLPTAKATVTEKGIRFKGLYYNCERAKLEMWFEKARMKKYWSITVSYEPREMTNIYIWDSEAKRYDTCYLLDWNSKNEGKTLTEIIYEQQKERLDGERHKTSAIEAKVNLNAEIDSIVTEAKQINKSAPSKSKSEHVSEIRENRAAERARIQKNETVTSNPELETLVAGSQQNKTEEELSPILRMIKAKVEEQLKND